MKEQYLGPAQVIRIRKKKMLSAYSWRRFFLALICSAAAAYVLFGVVFGLAVAKGTSMNPAVRDGDIMFVNRVGDYERGDLVIFSKSHEYENDVIKRVIGLPGETVDIENGQVTVDGEPLKEPYTIGETERKEILEYPVTLKSDEYFVMGDRRDNSQDSRNYGPVKREQLIGKEMAFFRIQKRTNA